MVPAVAVGEADDQGLVPRIGLALFPAPVHPVDVKAGGVHVKSPHGKGKGSAGRFSHLHEQLGDPGRVQAVQHPPHAVVVEEVRGDALPQEPLRGLALPEVAEEVKGEERKPRALRTAAFRATPVLTFSPGRGPTRLSTRDTSPMRSRMPATKPRWPRSYTCRSGVSATPKSYGKVGGVRNVGK